MPTQSTESVTITLGMLTSLKNLAEAREEALKENDKVPVTAATVELSLTEGKEDKIRAMLKQHEELWLSLIHI